MTFVSFIMHGIQINLLLLLLIALKVGKLYKRVLQLMITGVEQ